MATTPEAQELGALLRRLKDRSGRSYGMLAGRLHVSTSTLHRYCNGDAVPAEFAAVERFARLCGAEREELIELHRRWIVADDARTRGRSAAKPGASEPVAGAAVVADGGTDTGTDAGTEPDAEDVPEVTDAPDVSDATDPPGPRNGSARRRRVLVALAAAVVVAVVVPVAVFAAGGDGERRPERAAPA
ncbi:helix-turn-helix domain-containing protein, partial [Streptomyces sp. SID2131]|nr:helix-turn-helix domain-containing protein [Streptomyces sp. SID2131]